MYVKDKDDFCSNRKSVNVTKFLRIKNVLLKKIIPQYFFQSNGVKIKI